MGGGGGIMLTYSQIIFSITSVLPESHGLGRTYMQPASYTIFIVYM